MIRLSTHHRSESGQASMVTVAMFMMLFAVVAVSFTYIVVTTTRQATNETLQSTAKSAAESGVEDAKRLLVYCYGQSRDASGDYVNATARAVCPQVIGHKLDDSGYDCQDVLGAVASVDLSGFVVEEDGEGGYRAKIGGDNSDAQGSNVEYYQCLKIATKTLNYESVANANDSSVIVPLQLVNAAGDVVNVSRIDISWHRNAVGEAGDQPASNPREGSSLPSASVWNGAGNLPAVLRAELAGAPKSNVSVASLVSNDAAVTLRPSTSGSTSVAIMNYKPAYNDANGSNDTPNSQYPSGVPILPVRCNGNTGNYSCKVSLTGSFNLNSYDYYLRINAIYKNTHFSIMAYDASGNALYFDGVQPVVDVTGKSADSFTRVQAHLEPTYSNDDTNWWPEYAIDTDGKVCKDIDVFYDNGEDNCSY